MEACLNYFALNLFLKIGNVCTADQIRFRQTNLTFKDGCVITLGKHRRQTQGKQCSILIEKEDILAETYILCFTLESVSIS